MPVKVKNVFVCNECGSVQPKWLGKCPECGAWNSMVAEQIQKKPRNSAVERLGVIWCLLIRQVPPRPSGWLPA